MTDRFRPFGDKRNRFELASGGGDASVNLLATEVLPIFRITVRGSRKVKNIRFCSISR